VRRPSSAAASSSSVGGAVTTYGSYCSRISGGCSREGVVLDETRSLLVAFDVARWFETVDLSTATVGGDGAIRIDLSNNAGLLTAFESGVSGSASLYGDVNRDGELDAQDTRLDQ
jgi:hypothetical protein